MADTYNVFISWSTERSGRVAKALYDWLPMVVQSARPFMSEVDIEAGSRGLEEIGKALESTSVGIICLTPENLEKPWILFEAGALSKALGEKTRVCPYLFGDLRAENVKPPLGQFQATRAAKEGTRKLVGTVNRVLGGALEEDKLETLFEGMWGVFEGKLNAIGPVVGVVAPQRSEREMLAEVLELSRAGDRRNAEMIKRIIFRLDMLLRQRPAFPSAESESFEVGFTPVNLLAFLNWLSESSEGLQGSLEERMQSVRQRLLREIERKKKQGESETPKGESETPKKSNEKE